MKTAILRLTSLMLLVLVLLVGFALAAPQAKPADKVPSKQGEMQQSITATVTAIDYKEREITLKDEEGNADTFQVDETVTRFKEIKVGDKVRVDYHLGYVAELRPPTADEAKNPLVVQESMGKSAPGSTPALNATREIRAVVTVEGLDRPTQTITIKGPKGRYFTAQVDDPAKLEKVRIGETIVITFTEALAISLEKVASRP